MIAGSTETTPARLAFCSAVTTLKLSKAATQSRNEVIVGGLHVDVRHDDPFPSEYGLMAQAMVNKLETPVPRQHDSASIQ